MSELSTEELQRLIDNALSTADHRNDDTELQRVLKANNQFQALLDEIKKLKDERKQMIAEFRHSHRPFTLTDDESICRECGYACLELRLVQGDKQ